MSIWRGQQSLLLKPIIEATKIKIIERLNSKVEDIEYYLEYHKDYFSIKPGIEDSLSFRRIKSTIIFHYTLEEAKKRYIEICRSYEQDNMPIMEI